MNADDRDELRCLIEKAVKPTYQAATHAVEAVGKLHQSVENLVLEINGGPGFKGFKERLGQIETRCKINHDPDNTQKRQAITEQERIEALRRADRQRELDRRRDQDSLAPTSRRRRRWFDSTLARYIGIVLGTAAGSGTAAYVYARETAPNPPPAAAAPTHHQR